MNRGRGLQCIGLRRAGLNVLAALWALANCHPVFAEVDLSGYWQTDLAQDSLIRGDGPDPDTFLGLPINQDARAAALSWSQENLDELWLTCQPYSAPYILAGPFGFNIWPDMRADGFVVAWNISGTIDRAPTVIWMDGRTSSPEALHTPAGFTTGHWQGDTLVATTTHLSDRWLYRNGVPHSNQAVLTLYITRHDNLLSITGILQDPVYLTAPYVSTGIWVNDPSNRWFDPERKDSTCMPQESSAGNGIDAVPTYLTPPEDSLMYATIHYGIPHEAALGGAQTMYPEYAKRIRNQYTPPKDYCEERCCTAVSDVDIQFNTSVLQCK